MVADGLATQVKEDRRSAHPTHPLLLLVVVGGGSSDAAFVCQHVGADRWIGTSVGIAEAVAPEKTIPLSSRNGELSEKAGSGSRGNGFSGSVEGRLGADGTLWEKNGARRARLEANRYILATGGGPKS